MKETNRLKGRLLDQMASDDFRVFAIYDVGDGQFTIVEQCDQYFGAILKAEELVELGKEIQAAGERAQKKPPNG